MLLALDRGEREREMVSQLLAALCPQPLPREAVAQGFTDLMLACEARRPLPSSIRFNQVQLASDVGGKPQSQAGAPLPLPVPVCWGPCEWHVSCCARYVCCQC